MCVCVCILDRAGDEPKGKPTTGTRPKRNLSLAHEREGNPATPPSSVGDEKMIHAFVK